MLSAETLRELFEAGRPYAVYLETGSPDQRANLKRVYDGASLTAAQAALVGGFVRRMPVLVISGMWCGDCVNQCPLIARIAEANPKAIDLRFVDRDEHRALSDAVKICGGNRVPTVIWMAEDFEFVHLLGDRTLSRYRAIAATQLGPACPVPGAGVDADERQAVIQDWINEFERVHLILRTSGRLRQKHED